MTYIIAGIILTYIFFSIWIGFRASKVGVDSSEDYFLAGRTVSWVHLSLTIFATWFSTFTFLGYPGFFYTRGASWYLTTILYLLSAPFVAWFVGRKLWLLGRKKGYITPADLLADYYRSSGIRTTVAIICILALVPYSLIQFVGIGKVVEASTDGALPYWLGVGLAAFATAVYSTIGGVRAIIWTDILQGSLFFGVILLGAYVVIDSSGGIFHGFSSVLEVKPEIFSVEKGEVGSALTLAFIWTIGFAVLPHIWQRAYMGESAKAVSKSIPLFAILSLVLVTATMLTGVLGVALVSGIEDSDKYIPQLYESYLPWALPLLVLATFAAGMSTIDSQLLCVSSVLVRDIVRPMSGGDLSPSTEKLIGRVVVLTLILVLTILALMPGSQGSIILLASKGATIAVLLFLPLICCLNGFKVSGQAALASLILGGFVLGVLEFKVVEFRMPFDLGPIFFVVFIQGIILSTYRVFKGRVVS